MKRNHVVDSIIEWLWWTPIGQYIDVYIEHEKKVKAGEEKFNYLDVIQIFVVLVSALIGSSIGIRIALAFLR